MKIECVVVVGGGGGVVVGNGVLYPDHDLEKKSSFMNSPNANCTHLVV